MQGPREFRLQAYLPARIDGIDHSGDNPPWIFAIGAAALGIDILEFFGVPVSAIGSTDAWWDTEVLPRPHGTHRSRRYIMRL